MRTVTLLIACLLLLPQTIRGQHSGDDQKPVILYSGTPKKYEIGGIRVEGGEGYEDYVLIGLSGLTVGQKITVPGDEVTSAIKRYWRHGLFSKARIEADSIADGKIYLNIVLAQRPRISDIRYIGVKKSEREDLETKTGMIKGGQLTPNVIDRAKILARRYFDEKGFKNAEITVVQRDDPNNPGQVIVEMNIDKKEKVKVHLISIVGNTVLPDNKIKRLMKKTNEKGKWENFFRTKKYIEEKYEEDKERIIEKYNELGYRDAIIVIDSVTNFNEKAVDIYIHIEEGDKYFVRNLTWVGNTVYPTEALDGVLQMKPGDVYNQKQINDRLYSDPDAIGNAYYNQGYVFFNCDPVEVNIVGDSIDLEFRIVEGPQATINRVKITGNDRLYEEVVRRELRTRPGDLFSKDALERSYRELAQMGHFNPETINPKVDPDPQNGTVDINYILESKANDQIEFSAGWGQTGVIGKLSLKFTNFSMNNLFSKGAKRRGILPQGDGQTFTISGQTNGSYYQSYSVSFFDPWFRGRRPNQLSVSAFYSRQTGVNSNYYSSSYYSYYYNSLYGSSYSYADLYDKSKSVQIFGVAVAFGKRLRWPDDYFNLSAEVSFQRYILRDWQYFIIANGGCNNINFGLTLSRSSSDNPIFPRRGSEFQMSVNATPPYSAFDRLDYKHLANNTSSTRYEKELKLKYKWIEYHKWKFKGKLYTALTEGSKCPVLMTRVEFGVLGSYNKYKKSPFETFYVGGDGTTGYSTSYATETIGLRGYENGALTPYGYEGYAYTRMGFELRYPLMLETSTSIYCLAFAEGGNAWNDVTKFNPFDMKRSAGLGVRIFLPMVGMMGIDWAYGFDTVFGSSSYSGSQFHFIIGQEF